MTYVASFSGSKYLLLDVYMHVYCCLYLLKLLVEEMKLFVLRTTFKQDIHHAKQQKVWWIFIIIIIIICSDWL